MHNNRVSLNCSSDASPELLYWFSEQTLQPGPTVSLKCVATGNPPPQFIWTLDGFPVSLTFIQMLFTYSHHSVYIHENFEDYIISFDVSSDHSACDRMIIDFPYEHFSLLLTCFWCFHHRKNWKQTMKIEKMSKKKTELYAVLIDVMCFE